MPKRKRSENPTDLKAPTISSELRVGHPWLDEEVKAKCLQKVVARQEKLKDRPIENEPDTTATSVLNLTHKIQILGSRLKDRRAELLRCWAQRGMTEFLGGQVIIVSDAHLKLNTTIIPHLPPEIAEKVVKTERYIDPETLLDLVKEDETLKALLVKHISVDKVDVSVHIKGKN